MLRGASRQRSAQLLLGMAPLHRLRGPSAQQRKGSCLQAGWAASRAPVLRRHYVDAGSLLNDLSEPIKEQMFALGDRRAVWDFPLILFAKLLMFRESCGSFESNPAFVLHLRSQTKAYLRL